jgi:drug/metabolite transporter (DMT)-like permease
MLVIGILLALAAALAQSTSYILSRVFVVGRSDGSNQLLIISHILQGLAGVPLVVFLWPDDMPAASRYAWPLAGDAVFYMIGQAGLFFALRHTQASRVAPLLSMKVVLLAIFAAVFLHEPIAPLQWLAVLMAVAAAFVLNYTGGGIGRLAILGVSLAVIGYSLSDTCIKVFLEVITPAFGDASQVGPRLRASMLGVGLAYVICGCVAVTLLPWAGSRNWRTWAAAVPFSATWLLSMFLLYGSFATAGIVLANIVQSSRGIWSVVLGAVLASWGLLHLESHVGRGVFVRRLGATVLMCAAIALYMLGK